MSPPDAERVPGGVSEDMVPVGVADVVVTTQESSTESGRLRDGGGRVVGVEVEVTCCGAPSGQSGGVWSGACCTPTLQFPS